MGEVKFAPGEVVLRRYWRGGRIVFLQLMRVVADDERGLRLWQSAGYPYWRILTEDGQSEHDATIDQLGSRARLTRLTWTGSDVMQWLPAGEAYSLWWFWRDGTFDGWYANLEEPYQSWADRGCAGIDSADHALDLWIARDRRCRWEDEAEFEERTGHPMYWSAVQAAQIRATGERLVGLAECVAFPFDGTWCGYRPDAAWTVPAMPAGADRPRALA